MGLVRRRMRHAKRRSVICRLRGHPLEDLRTTLQSLMPDAPELPRQSTMSCPCGKKIINLS
jgi:hypothetical protein